MHMIIKAAAAARIMTQLVTCLWISYIIYLVRTQRQCHIRAKIRIKGQVSALAGITE